MTADRPLLLIVDASPYPYRAFYAIKANLTTRDGLPTRVIYGVTNMLLRVLREKKPAYIAAVWDVKGRNFRHELYPDYKANRPPIPEEIGLQLPHVKEIMSAMGISQLELDGYEADDVIASIVNDMQGQADILIISGDKDFTQLLSPHVAIWDPMKDEYLTSASVTEDLGIEPEIFVDVLALAGDSADNIPGVPGIGRKTALDLMRRYKSIDNLLQNTNELPQKTRDRILNNRDKILLWKRIIQLNMELPLSYSLEDFRLRPLDTSRLEELFRRFELHSLLKNIQGKGDAVRHVKHDESAGVEEKTIDIPDEDCACEVHETASVQAFLAELDAFEKKDSIFLDVDISNMPNHVFYINSVMLYDGHSRPIFHQISNHDILTQNYGSLEAKKIFFEKMIELLKKSNITKIVYNLKQQLLAYSEENIPIFNNIFDVKIAAYLLNKKNDDLFDAKNKKTQEIPKIDFQCKKVKRLKRLFDIFKTELKEKKLWQLFFDIEMPLVYILADMEKRGIKIDTDEMQKLNRYFINKIYELETNIYTAAGTHFNINSTKQLAEILFNKLSLPQLKKTAKKTGYSTDNEVLTELAQMHPLPNLILQYRNLTKLKSTYIDGIQKEINPDTHRIHTSFNQTVTTTGRLSSSNPNLQNIPIRTEEGRKIRRLFIADTPYYLLSADYSQIDLRVLAYYSQDEALLNAFRKGLDIHSYTASEVFGVTIEDVTSDMRRIAKTVNFGIVYGMSPFGLAKSVGISQKEANDFIERYFARYPGVKDYMQRIIAQVREYGYVTTILGRRRYLPEIHNKNKAVREAAERMAINMPIQGSSSDIIKLAMVEIFKWIQDTGVLIFPLLQVHDELIFEVSRDSVQELAEKVRSIMEGIYNLGIPLRVNVSWGENWAAMEK
ncbi:MAG: DNA polymerase I [Dissulfuribacterales bacterium]